MRLIKRYHSQMHGNYWRALLTCGLITGLVLGVVVMFRKLLIYPLSQPVSYVENAVLLLLMFVFLWRYRSKLDGRKITFKEGYVVCFGLGVVSSVVYGMFLYVYALRIDVNMQQRCYHVQRALEQNAHLSNEQVLAMTSPSSIAMSGVLLSAVISLIFAMMAALILRSEKAEVRIRKL